MKAPKKIPQRKCMGCMESRNKSELIRVVRSPEGEISLDLKGKKSGRGAYICKNLSCLKKARKGKRIEKALECEISDEIYSSLEAQLAEEDGKGEAQ